jgi:hypothetical protein
VAASTEEHGGLDRLLRVIRMGPEYCPKQPVVLIRQQAMVTEP